MIQQNELRIGNWVMDEDTIVRVTEIRVKHINHSQTLNCPYEDLRPIPLTPEVLERFGFKLQPLRQTMWVKGGLKIQVRPSGSLAFLYHEKMDESYYIGECKYIHQIQNLFFSLTGKELKEVK